MMLATNGRKGIKIGKNDRYDIEKARIQFATLTVP